MRRTLRFAVAALAFVVLPAMAQTLRVGVSSAVTSIDPHYHNLAPNVSMAAHTIFWMIWSRWTCASGRNPDWPKPGS